MRLSPRDPLIGLFHVELGDAELGLGHFDAAINEYHNATDAGYRPFYAYTNLAAACALEGKMDEATSHLAEARRLNPKLTVKWMIAHTPNLPPVFEGLRKAGGDAGQIMFRAREQFKLVAERLLSAIAANEGVVATVLIFGSGFPGNSVQVRLLLNPHQAEASVPLTRRSPADMTLMGLFLGLAEKSGFGRRQFTPQLLNILKIYHKRNGATLFRV